MSKCLIVKRTHLNSEDLIVIYFEKLIIICFERILVQICFVIEKSKFFVYISRNSKKIILILIGIVNQRY